MINSDLNPWGLTDDEVIYVLQNELDESTESEEWLRRILVVIKNLEEINEDLTRAIEETDDKDLDIGEL